MATDIHRRGHGRSLEGLSVVAGAAHLLPPDAATKTNAQAALLRASYQQYVGVSSMSGEQPAGQLSFRLQKSESCGPKLVQGDYTYTTSRKSLPVASHLMSGTALPSASASTASVPRGTIPAMVPTQASTINTAAWKAYGSPSAHSHRRPPLASAAGTGGASGAPPVPGTSGNRLPRVGGFKPKRPQSAPGSGHDPNDPAADLAPAIATIASTGSLGSGSKRSALALAPPAFLDVGILAVDVPDPLKAGRTDSGRAMFERTLPTDPYSKYVWEEQARKARANMTRHIAAMAAAAAVNGGTIGGGGGGGMGSRPGSARRSVVMGSSAGGSPTSTTSGGAALRPRFNSTTIAEVLRQGTDHRPPTVVGFAAADFTEDSTMPGPGDPRWAYTRLGRSQIERLQTTLKIVPSRVAPRPASAPTLGGGGASSSSAVPSPERSMGKPLDSTAPPVVSEPSQQPPQQPQARESVELVGGGGCRVELQAQGSGFGGMARTASGCGGVVRPGSAGMARPGSAGLARAGSSGLPRPGSAGAPRPSSASREAAAAAAAAVEYTGVPSTGVRGSSAGRTRESAPNPKVDLRTYLAEAAAEAEDEDEAGTVMLPVGDMAEGMQLYEAMAGLDPATVAGALHSLPVPPDQLAARLAEMVAAVAVVAAQQQLGEEDGAGGGGGSGGGALSEDRAGAHDEPDPPTPMTPMTPATPIPMQKEPAEEPAEEPAAAAAARSDAQVATDMQGLRRRLGTGDDALLALHGSSKFGRGAARYGSLLKPDYGAADAGVADVDSEASGGEEDGDGVPRSGQEAAASGPLGLGLGLAPRGGKGRPMSARPMSARPTSARPGSAMPSRARGSGVGGFGGGGGIPEGDEGMDVILEQSEGTAGED